MSHIFVVGIADTRGEELAYLASCGRAAPDHTPALDINDPEFANAAVHCFSRYFP
jgi:uncharacterized protein (UPF0261 family)